MALAQAFAGVVVVFQTAYPEVGVLVLLKSVADVLLRLDTKQQIG